MSETPEYGIFDYVNSINNKEYIFDEETYIKKNYSQFIINTAFSYFPDTVLIANEVNKFQNLSDRQHYDFLYFMIRKHKRFSKWAKKPNDEEVKLVAEFYGIGFRDAKELRPIIPKKVMDRILNMKGTIK